MPLTTNERAWIELEKHAVRLVDFDPVSLGDNCNSSNSILAYNENGGLLALYSTESFLTIKNHVRFFNSSGKENTNMPFLELGKGERVVFMCWNNSLDHLIILLSDGTIRFLSGGGKPVCPQILMEKALRVFPTNDGFVAITQSMAGPQVVIVESLDSRGYNRKTISELPAAMVDPAAISKANYLAVPRDPTASTHSEVFFSVPSDSGTTDILRCTFNTNAACSHRALVDFGSVVHMSLSPNKSMVALLMRDGSLWMTSLSFTDASVVAHMEEKLVGYCNLMWTSDSVLVLLSSPHATGSRGFTMMHLVCIDGGRTYAAEISPVSFCLQECDGVRLLSHDRYQLLQSVPQEVRAVFFEGSPSTALATAFDEYMSGGPSATGMMRKLQNSVPDLLNAIDGCVLSAGFEFDVNEQKRLLRIASFGRSICSSHDSDLFAASASRIRALNTLRSGKVGMLVSEAQFHHLGEKKVLRRLIDTKHYQCGYHLCEALGWNADALLTDWAISQLPSSADGRLEIEEERKLAKGIVNKLRGCRYGAFSDLAQLSNLRGARQASLVFLQSEPKIHRQIPMLLSINEPEVALALSLQCSNADMIYAVMVFLLRSRGSRAVPLLMEKADSRDALLQYMTFWSDESSLMTEVFRKDPKMRLRFLLERFQMKYNWYTAQESPLTIVGDVEALISSVKTAGLLNSGTAVQDAVHLPLHLKIVQKGEQLRKDLDDERCCNATAAELVRICVEHGRQELALTLKTELRMPEKMFQWCLLDAYAATNQWNQVDLLGAMPPRGNKPPPQLSGDAFVSVLIAHQRYEQAKKYIPRIPRVEQRLEYFVQCNGWKEAAADCRHQNDPDLLMQLKERAKGNQDILGQIESGWNERQDPHVLRFSDLFA